MYKSEMAKFKTSILRWFSKFLPFSQELLTKTLDLIPHFEPIAFITFLSKVIHGSHKGMIGMSSTLDFRQTHMDSVWKILILIAINRVKTPYFYYYMIILLFWIRGKGERSHLGDFFRPFTPFLRIAYTNFSNFKPWDEMRWKMLSNFPFWFPIWGHNPPL